MALVGGETATDIDSNDTSIRDRTVIIPVILAVILVILMLLLRSILAPVLLILTVILSFATALGVSAIVFNSVFGFPGADPAVPLYGFVFLVALGVDYNIFLMSRVREETLGHGTRRGILRGLVATGGGDHLCRARAGRDVRRARRHPDPVPRADRLHRRVRRAARHLRRALPARAGAVVRHRPRDLVALEAVAQRPACRTEIQAVEEVADRVTLHP